MGSYLRVNQSKADNGLVYLYREVDNTAEGRHLPESCTSVRFSIAGETPEEPTINICVII